MTAPAKVLVVSASPDALNVNNVLRLYLARGFEEALEGGRCLAVAYEAGVRAAQDFGPDLLVVFGSVMLDETDYVPLVAAARRAGARVAFWLHDDPYEFDAASRILPLADVIFTNDEASLDFYPPMLPVHHLPLAACPAAHARPIRHRGGPELFFCGHLYRNRRRFLEAVAERAGGFERRALLLGTGAETGAIPGWTRGQVANEELAGFHNAALAVLNIGRDLNLANARFVIRASTPGPRTFEAALAGAAQIVVCDGLEIEEFYEPGREVLITDSADGFLAHWERLRVEPELSLALGRAAQARTRASHTYAHRAARLAALAMA
jgi:spore maturation protein CgeB